MRKKTGLCYLTSVIIAICLVLCIQYFGHLYFQSIPDWSYDVTACVCGVVITATMRRKETSDYAGEFVVNLQDPDDEMFKMTLYRTLGEVAASDELIFKVTRIGDLDSTKNTERIMQNNS